MDAIDQKLLTIIQHHFPATSRPYLELAKQLETSEEDVLQRVNHFRQQGLIRRIGGVFDSKNLGYVSTLCAVSVPEEKIETAARFINAQAGVTHHYVRDHAYNLWFTLISPSTEQQRQTLSHLKEQLQKHANSGTILNLPAKRVFKIKVQFNADSTGGLYEFDIS